MSSDRAFLAAMIDLASADRRDWDCTIQHILGVEARVLDVERVSFWSLRDDLGSEQVLLCEMAYDGATGAFERGSRFPVQELREYVDAVREHAPLTIEDVRACPRLRGARGYLDERKIVSVLGCPVWCAGRFAGILNLEHVGPARRWSVSDQGFAAAVAHTVSAALEARARTEAQAYSARMAFLEQAARTLGHTLDVGEVARRAVALVVPRLADGARVDLVDEGVIRTAAFDYRMVEGRALLEEAMQDAADAPRAGQIAGRAVARRDAILVPDVTNDAFVDSELKHCWPNIVPAFRALGIQSMISVPLLVGEQVVGALTLFTATRRFGFDDLGQAEQFAKHLAAALENARLHERLQAALRARDEFIALAGHQLRTPLTALQLTAEDLVRKSSNETMARLGGSVVKQAKRLDRLSNQMLDAARISGEGFPCSPSPTDLASVAREAAEMVEPVLQRSGCTLVLRADEPVVGQWDATQLDEMLSCLLDNAAKFGAGQPVEVTVQHEDGVGTVSVRDHGQGIPPDRVPFVFDEFERAVSASHYGGLGLGLFIARAVAEAHGGSLTVDNRPGDGVTFTARLPLQPQPSARPSERPGAPVV